MYNYVVGLFSNKIQFNRLHCFIEDDAIIPLHIFIEAELFEQRIRTEFYAARCGHTMIVKKFKNDLKVLNMISDELYYIKTNNYEKEEWNMDKWIKNIISTILHTIKVSGWFVN